MKELLSEKTIVDIALEIHRDFIDKMYPLFGLDKHPEYCVIEIKPLISLGGIIYGKLDRPDRIIMNDSYLHWQEVRNTSCHESAHILHPFARREYERTKRRSNKRNCFLGEIVAHLGSLVYLEKIYPSSYLN